MEDAWSGHRLAIPAIASAGAATIHAAAAFAHSETADLARVFIALAVAQAAAAAGALRADRISATVLVGVNGAAALGWVTTRLTGIPWIDGLDVAGRAAPADTIAMTLALVAVTAAAWTLGRVTVPPPRRAIPIAAVVVVALTVPGLVDATTHDHDDHASAAEPASDHAHADEPAADHAHEPASTDADDGHGHIEQDELVDALGTAPETDAGDHAHPDGSNGAGGGAGLLDHAHHEAIPVDIGAWPRPWDPTRPIDFSGVDGVTDDQRARAEQLVTDTLRELPRFADVSSLAALGYRSIGDAGTGVEHFVNTSLIHDDRFLDPTAPESLVYEVDGDQRILVSAMFIAAETPIDDPALTDFAGPLMQWHVHDDLCWGLDDNGVPVVRGVLESFGGTCPPGTVNAGGENPMVHVWIAPHACGPFAALEGHGAGQASVSDGARMDQCTHEHATRDGGHGGDGDDEQPDVAPYDPELPIDLSGVPGVTAQQRADAEHLVEATLRDLPQWADLDVVETAGFTSIGDSATGHEHYIQWDWIDDDTILDPDHPESLVFEPQADGSKRLVAAMYMLPSGTRLDDVPDLGGALMQWHVHGDLCFTADREAPQVAGVKPVGTSCPAPLVDGTAAPMIHVWITPHECGPFAALDGIAGGQVADGETVRCDRAHGSH